MGNPVLLVEIMAKQLGTERPGVQAMLLDRSHLLRPLFGLLDLVLETLEKRATFGSLGHCS